MPQFDMSTVVALALAAGVSVSVIGIAMAIAVAKVKMLTKLTLKAMADKATNYVEERESKREQQAIKKLTADISRDTAKAYMVDEVVQAGMDAGMSREEALADWWERESAASFGSQQKTDWHQYYIVDSQSHGLSYEEAIEWVDRQEAMIESALDHVRTGVAVHDAIELARAEHST